MRKYLDTSMKRKAFTLVEVIVTVGIISALVGLLLPAVGSARESARLVHCKNNLKQLATAILLHEQSMGHFPSAGWGSKWTGDPDKGTGRNQPGSWTFSVLPHMEQSEVFIMAGDGNPSEITTEQKQNAARAFEINIEICLCPSKSAQLNPSPGLWNMDPSQNPSRNDYAINGGDNIIPWGDGPDPDNPSFQVPIGITGVAFQGSEIRTAHLIDGLSNVYLAGEKGDDPLDIGTLAGGEQNTRWTIPDETNRNFGSQHPAVFNMVMCDGSVRTNTLDMDPETHQRLGNRKDGQIAP